VATSPWAGSGPQDRELTSIKRAAWAALPNGVMVSAIPTSQPSPTPASSTVPLPLPRKRHRRSLLVLLLLALLTWPVWRWWRGPELPVQTVVRRDFVQTVVASGHVETPHRVDIGAQITATVRRVLLAEGQNVAAGALLVDLENSELQAALRQAQVAVQQAQAKLRQLREVQAPVAQQSLRQAQATLDNARAAQRRNEDLFQRGFIGQAALDEARKAVELADAQAQTANQQLASTGARGSDTAVAEAAVAQARANVEAAQARLRYTRLTAPVAGTLIHRDVEPGDVVQPGKLLLTLSPAGLTQLVLNIDEKNLRLIALGQRATASADAYPQERFAAVLAFINPAVNPQTGAVEVKLDVANPPGHLRQDMTVSVDIAVAQRPQALLVPAGALHDADSATPWVLRVQGSHAQRQPLRVGLRSGAWAEVLEGLQEGERVLAAGAPVVAGARVRVQPGSASAAALSPP
jgi:HlyD family secretion protein